MTGTLNTTVAGSPGTCVAGGDALDAYAGWVQKAGDLGRGARSVAWSGWHGPAHNAFDKVMQEPTAVADDLAFTCQEGMRALKEFGSSLGKVQEKMVNTLDEATRGGLEVQGPLILPPSPPPPKPGFSSQASSAADADAMYRDYQAKMRDWIPLANEYNRKVTLFNTCSDHVRDARRSEDEAHATLRDALGPIAGKVDGIKFTFGNLENFEVSTALGYVQGAENARHDAFIAQQRSMAASTLFQRFATGNIVDLTDEERAILTRAAAQTGAAGEMYGQRVAQYESWIKHVPENVRAAVASYPTLGALEAADSGLAGVARGALKATPWVGSAATIGMEAWNAHQGAQTWEKAAAKAGAGIAGATAGGMAGAAIGSVLPGPGTVIGGIVGGVVGGMGGSYVVDAIAPGPDKYAQPKAEPADTTIHDESKIVRPGASPQPPPLVPR